MKRATVLYLAIVIYYSATQGADAISPCDENSWNAFDCIRSLQENILQLQEQVENQAAQLKVQSIQLNETQANLRNIQNSSVPIGFVYVQLPERAEPHQLWPNVIWSDISFQYAGLFFRVLGGGSAHFNVTQAESGPRISRAEGYSMSGRRDDVAIPSNGWSLTLSSGGPPNIFTNWRGIRFFQSTEELRPRNKAVRVWQRIN